MHAVPGYDKKIHEITVKSFSPARHITQPGFHLLSLYPGHTPSHAHSPCLLPRANGTFIRLYIPAVGLTIVILIFSHMRSARRAARLRLDGISSSISLDLAADPSSTRASPYSASSTYSYSYAYSNTPPGSQQGRDRIRFDFEKRLEALAWWASDLARHRPFH